MTERIKQEIVDNIEREGSYNMDTILNSEICNANRFDVSSGYFRISGYGLLRNSIEKMIEKPESSMRLMLGENSIDTKEGSFEEYAARYGRNPEGAVSVESDMDDAELALGLNGDTASLIKLLRRDNVHVRTSPNEFNHSKCYIFGRETAFIGSSNFTHRGLIGNHELNAGIYQPASIGITQNWFDRMWNEGRDVKQDLLNVLLRSKFGTPAEPYEVYMKILFERFKPMLNDDDGGREKYDVRLTRFQGDAVRSAMHIVSEYGGAMIADATGLGKTIMGIELIRQKVLNENKKVMLIAPAQVLSSMWEEKLKDADINIREKITIESLGRDNALEDIHKYKKIDFVLIDESQNFRSKNAKRRANLMKLMSVGRRKQAILLSATPINNSIMDLYYQLSIITREDDAYFAKTIRIPNLYKHMRDAANRNGLEQGLAKIQNLLDMVMVRRTRSFIREHYPDEIIQGKRMRFLKHEYNPIHYSISEYFGNIFEVVLEKIESLTMAPYGIEYYDRDLPMDERNKAKRRGSLQTLFLLKRFESSIVAVRTSLKNRLEMYQHVRRILREGRILRTGDFNRIMAKWNALEGSVQNTGASGSHNTRLVVNPFSHV